MGPHSVGAKKMEEFLLRRIFPSSGVAGMVLDFYLPLCPVQYVLHLFRQYPAIHTNFSLSNCTISNYKDLNRSSDFLVIN